MLYVQSFYGVVGRETRQKCTMYGKPILPKEAAICITCHPWRFGLSTGLNGILRLELAFKDWKTSTYAEFGRCDDAGDVYLGHKKLESSSKALYSVLRICITKTLPRPCTP